MPPIWLIKPPSAMMPCIKLPKVSAFIAAKQEKTHAGSGEKLRCPDNTLEERKGNGKYCCEA